jgi:hypothetical protein
MRACSRPSAARFTFEANRGVIPGGPQARPGIQNLSQWMLLWIPDRAARVVDDAPPNAEQGEISAQLCST